MYSFNKFLIDDAKPINHFKAEIIFHFIYKFINRFLTQLYFIAFYAISFHCINNYLFTNQSSVTVLFPLNISIYGQSSNIFQMNALSKVNSNEMWSRPFYDLSTLFRICLHKTKYPNRIEILDWESITYVKTKSSSNPLCTKNIVHHKLFICLKIRDAL